MKAGSCGPDWRSAGDCGAWPKLWWAIAMLFQQEMPYPSGADLFWMLGYLPMYWALWQRRRTLPNVASRRRLWASMAASLFALITTSLLVLKPILETWDPQAAIESGLTLAYPVADMVLLVLALQLVITHGRGALGTTWRWVAAGFAVCALADLGFAYAAAHDLYYPDGQATLLSTLGADVPYALSYVLYIVGLRQRGAVQKELGAHASGGAALSPVPNTHVLVFTRADDTVTSVSDNFRQVFPVEPTLSSTLSDLLGTPPDEARKFLKDIRQNGKIAERPSRAVTRSGRSVIGISGVAFINAPNDYEGSLLLLRLICDQPHLDNSLSAYQKSMVGSLLRSTGTDQQETEEVRALLGSYGRQLIEALREEVAAQGGSSAQDALRAEMQALCDQRKWAVQIESDCSLQLRDACAEEMRMALPALVEAARKVVARRTSEEEVNKAVQDVRGRFTEATLRNIASLEIASGNLA